MLKRYSIVFFIFGFFLYGEYLTKVKLDNRRLEPFFLKNISVIKDLYNYALVIVDDNELYKLKKMDYEILDTIRDTAYYLVKTKNPVELSDYGKILMKDRDIYILKIQDEKIAFKLKEKYLIHKLRLIPIVQSKDKFNIQFKYNPYIQEIVNNVNPDTVLSFVRNLQNYKTRYSTHDSCFKAAFWIKEKLYEYGCDTVILQYHTAGHSPNVIGVKYGTVYPSNKYSIICGHFDSYSNYIPNLAPGADDDASGIAGILECARVLKDYRFEYTIKFIAFSGEEFWMLGSYYYAQMARNQNDSIIAVINGDMIGYANSYPESIDVIGKISDPSCEWIVDFYINCANSYTNLKTLKMLLPTSPADQEAFWDYGYAGILLIEDEDVWGGTNPFYHTLGDTIGGGYNDNLFATEVIKAEIATIVSLSDISYSPYSPEKPILFQPFDCAKISTNYPEFIFKSKDLQNDQIQYEIFIDDNPEFLSPEIILTSVYQSDSIVKYDITFPLEDKKIYFWKVQCKDPSGTNLWSNFSDIYSFTIDTSLKNTCSFFQHNSFQFLKNSFYNTKIFGDSVGIEPYGYIYDTLLYEDFEGSFPSSWSIYDGNSDGIYWNNGTTNDIGIFTPPNYNSKYAYYSDDDAGYTSNSAEEIISPKIYIPQGSFELVIIYDFGIKIRESGEKMILKTKKFNNSWLNWINRYSHYFNSSSGTFIYQIPSNYFPMESLQLKWSYTDAGTSNHRGYACGIDNVTLLRKIPQAINYAEMITKEISFEELNFLDGRELWGDLIWEKKSLDDSIGIKIEYYDGSEWLSVPDELIPGNSNGIYSDKISDTISLNPLPTDIFNKIRVKVLFKRYSQGVKSPEEPLLLSLEVGNISGYVGIKEKNEQIFSISNNIVYSGIDISFYLKKEGFVSIDLFDITGRNIEKILENKKYSKGIHKLNMSLKDKKIKNGVYFIVFSAENERIIRKIIMIR